MFRPFDLLRIIAALLVVTGVSQWSIGAALVVAGAELFGAVCILEARKLHSQKRPR